MQCQGGGLQASKGLLEEVLTPETPPPPMLRVPHRTVPPQPCLSLFPQSGGGNVPPMKVVTPGGASRLKAAQGQAGSPDKGKHSKQRTEYMRIQAQQQVRAEFQANRPLEGHTPRLCYVPLS